MFFLLFFLLQISLLCSAGTAVEVIAIIVMELITLVSRSAAISPLTDLVTPGPGGPDAASTRRTLPVIFDVAAGMELQPSDATAESSRRRATPLFNSSLAEGNFGLIFSTCVQICSTKAGDALFTTGCCFLAGLRRLVSPFESFQTDTRARTRTHTHRHSYISTHEALSFCRST